MSYRKRPTFLRNYRSLLRRRFYTLKVRQGQGPLYNSFVKQLQKTVFKQLRYNRIYGSSRSLEEAI